MDFDGWKTGRFFLTFQTSNNSKVQSVSIEPRHSCRKDAMSASAIWGCLIRGTFRRGSQISGATKQVGITSNCVHLHLCTIIQCNQKKIFNSTPDLSLTVFGDKLGDWLHHLDCLLGEPVLKSPAAWCKVWLSKRFFLGEYLPWDWIWKDTNMKMGRKIIITILCL